jgi:NAD(P)-dependent dehydrogenase (short-subunit alcohol dehydrogenase family)
MENPHGISLNEKIAVVIGGTGGIGAALADGLAAAGATVVPTSRNAQRVHSAVERLQDATGGSLPALTVDATDEASLQELTQVVTDRFERIDILINASGQTLRKSAFDTTVDEWNSVLAANLSAPFLASKILGKKMAENGGGRILNIASMGSFVGLTGVSAYCASKGGLAQLTRSLAQEWAPLGITVNAIAPGFFETDLNREIIAPGTERRRKIEERTPMSRIGNLDELVGAVLYLVSDAAGFVTGTILPIDGGFLASGI